MGRNVLIAVSDWLFQNPDLQMNASLKPNLDYNLFYLGDMYTKEELKRSYSLSLSTKIHVFVE